MTIDERLEKLTERHEALLRSLRSLHAQQERKWANTDKRFAQLAQRFALTRRALGNVVRRIPNPSDCAET